MSLEARLHYFACEFLGCVITFFHYLYERVAIEDIGSLYLKWSGKHEDLAEWAAEERFFPIEKESPTKSEKEKLFSAADTLCDSLTFRWGDALKAIAIEMHRKYPAVSESMWLYYSYCRLLRQVLTEFEGVLQEPGSSTAYYEHYREHLALFEDMAAALEGERPFLDTQTDVGETTIKAVWDDIDAYTSKLGAEWRQTVHSAARDLKLPDFGKNII